MIAVIDIGTGNVNSVVRALSYIGAKYQILTAGDEKNYSALVFPGVGAFKTVSERLRDTGLDLWIRKKVLQENLPFLGICLGMQLMGTFGDEGGGSEGLGLVKGAVRKMGSDSFGLRLPHIGWNEVTFSNDNLMMKDIPDKSCFYFVHSYALRLEETVDKVMSEYGEPFIAGFTKKNIWGTQFHPEKSQRYGLQLLSNFLEMSKTC